ncbi:MAG: hypothetical protein PVG36_08485, partial [Methyloceanibacter sp.]
MASSKFFRQGYQDAGTFSDLTSYINIPAMGLNDCSCDWQAKAEALLVGLSGITRAPKALKDAV